MQSLYSLLLCSMVCNLVVLNWYQFVIFVSVPAGYSVDPVNYLGNEQMTPMLRPNKRGREAEDFNRQQKLQISLNYNIQDEADRSASMQNPNPVSTGLRLSYDDDERNSSVTTASGSMTAGPSIILSLGENIRSEFDRQKEEFDHYIKIQVLQQLHFSNPFGLMHNWLLQLVPFHLLSLELWCLPKVVLSILYYTIPSVQLVKRRTITDSGTID